VFWVSDDHVIENFDFQKLTGADEVASYFDVGFARRGFSARVVMHQDNCRGASDDGQSEYADRVNKDRVVGSERNYLVRFNSAAGVKE
jgi:hypothetical protein